MLPKSLKLLAGRTLCVSSSFPPNFCSGLIPYYMQRMYISTLSAELANESRQLLIVMVRNAAGLALKNALSARVRIPVVKFLLRSCLLACIFFFRRSLDNKNTPVDGSHFPAIQDKK